MQRSTQIFYFNLRRDHQKYILWASRLWVGRRKEPILGYVPRNYEKNNSGSEELNTNLHLRNENLNLRSNVISLYPVSEKLWDLLYFEELTRKAVITRNTAAFWTNRPKRTSKSRGTRWAASTRPTWVTISTSRSGETRKTDSSLRP